MWISLFLVFFCFGATPFGDGILVVVENEILLKSDVDQQVFAFASQQNVDPYKNPDKFDFLYAQVLKQMTNNLVLYDLATKDTTVVVLDQDVEETLSLELQKRVELAGSVKSLENMLGEPLSLIRSKLRLEIKKAMQIELYTSQFVRSTFPSVSDVKSFYSTYKDSLPVLEKRLSFSVLEWPVVVNNKKREAVVSFLTSLKDSVNLGLVSFSELAKRFSEDLGSSQKGGQLGYTLRGSLVPEYENVAYGLSVGEVSLPFFSPFGCHIVLLEGRIGEKIKTSHILKTLEVSDKDVSLSVDSLNLFLNKQDVYNYVNKFDSLCTHFSVKNKKFQGVFLDVNVSSLPDFFRFLSREKEGFVEPFLNKNNLYAVRVLNVKEPEKQTFENSYNNLYNLTRSKLIEDKINAVINNHSQKIYIKTFY